MSVSRFVRHLCWLCMVCFLFLVSCAPVYPRPPQAVLEFYAKQCATVISYVEDAKKRDGVVPLTLPANLQGVLSQMPVPATYHPYLDARDFEIRIGEYDRDGWDYTYASMNRKWYLDH